jgi:hypothetical protein
VDEVDEEVVYLGSLLGSYGHFLLESLARTWVLPDVDRSTRIVFHRPRPARRIPRPWMLPILAAFGVPQERILFVDNPTRFRRAIVPESLFDLQQMAHQRWAEPYQAVAARIAAGTTPSTQPVYLSRRLLASPLRPIIGEAELEDVLRENGFLVAHPKTMTFADQVRLFNANAHTDIFTSTGSAAHNVLFALHRPRLHLLTDDDPASWNFLLCSALVEAPTSFVNCLGPGERSAADRLPPGQRRLPEVMAIGKLTEYLDECSLLKSRVRAAAAGRDPAALRRAYDEAWFYAHVRAAGKGAALAAATEREAVDFARGSWPVSLVLAWYYARRDAAQLDGMVRQLTDLVAVEFDINRLARYRPDVEEGLRAIVSRCQAATADRLVNVVFDRFFVDLTSVGDDSQGEARRDTRASPASGDRRRRSTENGIPRNGR